jgi:hypothetical protein
VCGTLSKIQVLKFIRKFFGRNGVLLNRSLLELVVQLADELAEDQGVHVLAELVHQKPETGTD